MDMEKIENILGEVNENIYATDLTAEKVTERIKGFSNEDGKIDLMSFQAFVLQESRDYATILLHDVLERLLAEGYLNDPDKRA